MEEASSSSSSSPAPPSPVPRKIFVGGISAKTDEAALVAYFERYGRVQKATVARDRSTGNSRGFGFVTFCDDSSAISASNDSDHSISDKKVDVKRAIPKEYLNGESNRYNSSEDQNPNGKKIFVGGLHNKTTEDEFRAYFEKFGALDDSIVMCDPIGKTPRGFGFVTFSSEESAREVLKNQFHELNGKRVEIKKAVPKMAKKPSPARSDNGNNNGYYDSGISGLGGPPLNQFNVHSHAPYYQTNSADTPYYQTNSADNDYAQLCTYYYPYDDTYSIWYPPPYAADASAWHGYGQMGYHGPCWAGQGMMEIDSRRMEVTNLCGQVGDFNAPYRRHIINYVNGGSNETAPHLFAREAAAAAETAKAAADSAKAAADSVETGEVETAEAATETIEVGGEAETTETVTETVEAGGEAETAEAAAETVEAGGAGAETAEAGAETAEEASETAEEAAETAEEAGAATETVKTRGEAESAGTTEEQMESSQLNDRELFNMEATVTSE